MSCRDIPLLTPLTNPGIAEIVLTLQIIMTPARKEILTDAASVGTWTYRTPRRVIRTGIDGSTPGDIGNSIVIVEKFSPDLIGIIGTTPPYGLNLIQEVGDIRKSTSPDSVRQYQKLDSTVDRKFSNNPDSTSIFRKVLSEKLSNSSRRDLYTRCGISLTEDPVLILTPQFVYLGLLTIDVLDKGSGISTPDTRIRRLAYGAHWSSTNHIFSKTAEVVVSEENSDYEYNYKTYLQIWR